MLHVAIFRLVLEGTSVESAAQGRTETPTCKNGSKESLLASNLFGALLSVNLAQHRS